MRIRDVYSNIPDPDHNFSIPDPRSASKNPVFEPKKMVSMHSEIWSGFFISDPDPGTGSWFCTHPGSCQHLKGVCHQMNNFLKAYKIKSVLYIWSQMGFNFYCIWIARKSTLLFKFLLASMKTLTNFGDFTESRSRIYIPLLRHSGFRKPPVIL